MKKLFHALEPVSGDRDFDIYYNHFYTPLDGILLENIEQYFRPNRMTDFAIRINNALSDIKNSNNEII